MVKLMFTFVAMACLGLALARSREVCPGDTSLCPTKRAECVSGQGCQCPETYNGVSYLGCHRHKYDVCTIHDTTLITPFSGGNPLDEEPNVRLDLPCRYLATDVTVTPVDNTLFFYGGSCRTQVYPLGEIVQPAGINYMKGFDVYFTTDTGAYYYISVGPTADGNPNISDASSFSSSNNPTWTSGQDLTDMVSILGPGSEVNYDGTNNILIIRVPNCAFEIFYRGNADPTDISGLSIGLATQHRFFDITYNNLQSSVCLKPCFNSNDLRSYLGTNHIIDAFLLTAMSNEDIANEVVFPGPEMSKCRKLFKAAQNKCNDAKQRRKGIQRCAFSLHRHNFAQCYDKSEGSPEVLTFMATCLRGYCEQDAARCESAKTQLTNSMTTGPVEERCEGGHTGIQRFLDVVDCTDL